MDDLPNDELRLIAQDLGLDAAVKVWKRLAGTTMSLPARFPKDYSMRYIHAHYDGRNTSQLARALGITTRTVQGYLAAKMPAPRPGDRASDLQTAMPL